MAEQTGIEWTDATFNPWTGCLAVSPGCEHCYAAARSRRLGSTFGGFDPGSERKRTSVGYWNGPRRWNRKAEAEGRRLRVFCASMADVFDNRAPPEWRADLWSLIRETPAIDWQLLTKRPQNIAMMLPPDWGPTGWPNVWLGTTAEDQARFRQRTAVFLAVPAAVHFLSCEPLLGDLYLRAAPINRQHDALGFPRENGFFDPMHPLSDPRHRIDWVIAGGESGHGARPPHPIWFSLLRDQCQEVGVPFFFKQWGEWHPHGEAMADASINVLGNPDIEDKWHSFGDGISMWKAGKKAAGSLLDGRAWKQMPGSVAA